MIGFFKKIEEQLLIKRPDIWFTRVLWLAPIAIVGLILSILLAYKLPMTSNMIVVVIVVSIIAAVVLFWWYRLQYLYFDKTINPKQLLRIFLINLGGITTLTWMVIAIPVIMQGRIDKALTGSDFSIDVQDLRVAFIKQEHINLIRSNMMQESTRDSLYAANQEEYYNVTNGLANLRANKFHEQNFTDVSLSFEGTTSSADSSAVITPPPVDTTAYLDTLVADSTITPQTQTRAPQAQTGSSQQQTNNATRPPAYVYTDLENFIRGLDDGEIAAIKVHAAGLLRKYNFSSFSGDTTFDYDLNSYFATLSSQSLNLYNSRNFLKTETYWWIFFSVFIVSQLLVILLGKTDILVPVLSFGFLLANIAFIFNLINDAEIRDSWFWFYLVLLILLFVPSLIFSGIFNRRAPVNRIRNLSLQFLTLSLPLYLTIIQAFVALLLWPDDNFSEAWQITIFFTLVFAMSLFFNYLFYKRYHYILNLPRR